MASTLRIAYFGLPVGALALAARGHHLCFAALSPVHQPGRRRLRRRLGTERIVDCYDGPVDEAELHERLHREPIDLLVSWFWTRLLPTAWVERPRLGAVGVHPSLLPRHRGPNPYFAVIDAGEPLTGVTVHCLTGEYDRGAILCQVPVEVGNRNSWQLARALDAPSLQALCRVVDAFAQGGPPEARAQDESLATWAPEPEGALLSADWEGSTASVLRRIRALSPVPGLALELLGCRFYVTDAVQTDDYPRALLPKEAYLGERLVLRTGDGAIAVERAQVVTGEDQEPERTDGKGLVRLIQQA